MNTFALGVIIIVYLLSIAYLGFLGYKKTVNTSDYLVAGRNIHPFVMATSYGATFISTSAIIGFGGVAGLFGMGLMWLTFLNILFGIFIAFVFFGKKTRKMGHHMDVHTFPEFLGKRYQSDFVQRASGLIIFISMPLYAAVVLIGGARFLESVLTINFDIALTIFSLIIAAYVIAGGLKGVMYTDALQGAIMFLGMIFLLVMTYAKLGGISAANNALTNMADLVPENLKAIGHVGWTSMPAFNSAWWWTLVSTIILGVGIGVLAQPQLIVRFMTVKSDRELNRGVLIGGLFIFVLIGFIYIVGSLSNVYFYNETGKISIQMVQGNPDSIIPEYINAAMPKWFVYIFMLSLLSAGMSTLSSQFHTMGTSIGRDLYQSIFKGRKRSILITRVGIIISITISVILGYKLPMGIIARGTAIFFGICSATFLPSYFGGLYWKRSTKTGAVSSILAGLLVSVFYLVFIHKKEAEPLGISQLIFGKDFLIEKFPWPVVDPILIALPMSIVVFVVVSLLTKKFSDSHLKECFND